MHDTGSNTERITIATQGIYVVSVSLYLAAATGQFGAKVVLNGATDIWMYTLHHATTSGAKIIPRSFAYPFSASDYIYARVYQDSGGAVNLTAGNYYGIEFSATFLSYGEV
jgi:hypothetical protein